MAEATSPRRILIVRPSALGDVCRTVPVLVSLARAYPEALIDWVVRDTFAAPVAAHPDLNEVIPFPRARFARWWRSPSVARDLVRWLKAVRRRRYDLVFDCQGLGRSGLITWATGAPRRIGFRSARELAWLGYNVRHPADAAVHTVDLMLSLLEAEGIELVHDMRLHVARDDERWWVERRREMDLGEGAYALLAPTARWASKRWPIDRWCEVAAALLRRGFGNVVVVGGPDEQDQVAGLVAVPGASDPGDERIISLVGETTIGQMMAVTAAAGLIIAHDSAPLHMAVGLDRPCLGLFGPTNPDKVGPYHRPESIIRCYEPQPGRRMNYRAQGLDDASMRDIPVELVLERIDAVLPQREEARP